MKPEEFIKYIISKSDKDYGICSVPTEPQDGLNILIHHLLGDDWYCSIPQSTEQVNTDAIYAILCKYKQSRFKLFIKRLWQK